MESNRVHHQMHSKPPNHLQMMELSPILILQVIQCLH